ncbi:hypothetical protein [Streptomyces mirabilis]|uniref:hypothetical protein n=1 Tax=Streptomyces mirabilis TaxID=68239 RepID=UPI0036858B51
MIENLFQLTSGRAGRPAGDDMPIAQTPTSDGSLIRQGDAVSSRRLRGGAQVNGAIERILFEARQEVWCAVRFERLGAEGFGLYSYLSSRCLRRGLRVRFLVAKAALDEAHVMAFMRRINADGAAVRLTDELESHVLVADRVAALIADQPQDPEKAAIVTEEPGVVCNMAALYRLAWEQAVDFDTFMADRLDFSPEDQQLLELITRPGKDASRARDLGVSLRTFHRRVANLYGRLGVTSRMEAVLVARDLVA